jgi:Reverse transcriptase (RNA-dependent DNA polymerase)
MSDTPMPVWSIIGCSFAPTDVPYPLPRRIAWVRVSITSPRVRPSPNDRRVGIRIRTFEACSGFTLLRPIGSLSSPRPLGERPLGIPTIRDRVIQTAAKIVIEPIFEADFEGNAYGYRPASGPVAAVKEVHRHLCRGYADVVDADLSEYFDAIPHSELIKSGPGVSRIETSCASSRCG